MTNETKEPLDLRYVTCETSLYEACLYGNKKLALSLISRLQTLIPKHRDRLVRHDDWDSTPLHEACRHGWAHVVQLLVEKVHHDVDATDRLYLQSPLHICCQNGQLHIAIYLTKHGCNPVLRDSKGKEPIDYAIENDNIYLVRYLCKHCSITSAMMLASDRTITTLNILNKVLHDKTRHLDWEMSNGDSIVEIVCYSKLLAKHLSPTKVLKLVNHVQARIDDKSDIIPHLICRDLSCVSCIPSVVMMEWLGDTRLDPMKLVISCNWKTADGDTLFQHVCQTESCLSRISSTLMLKWLIDSTLDLTKLVPNYKTAEGHTLFQLICQSELCVSHISSTEILKWLTNTDHDLMKLVPNYKTADDDSLLTLICQTESCVSRISSNILKTWLKQTNVDLLLSGINWKTADGNTVISILHQLSEYGPSLMHIHASIIPTDIIITPHWESIDCKVSFLIFYRSELCISQTSSKELLKWLQKTNLYPEKIVSPNWKTADGDTLLQLVCQSDTCVSHTSSTVMTKWLNDSTCDVINFMFPHYKTADGDTLLQLACHSESCLSFTYSAVVRKLLNDTTLDLEELVTPYYKTADGDTLLQLVCQSESCVSRISSAVMLKWLNETKVSLKFIISNYKTACGDTLLQLVCQSESCVSRIPAETLKTCLKSTTVDLYIENLDRKTLDSVTVIEVMYHLQSRKLSFGTPIAVVIIPSWENVVGSKSFQLYFFYDNESYISHASSTDMLKWLQKTNLNLERIAVPNWKTADGDTLLQLVCQTKSYVSRTSSTILLKLLTHTSLDLELILPNFKTADCKTLFQLVCQSKSCVIRISSTVMLKWLTDTTHDLMELVALNHETADGDTLLQLICRSESCVSRVSSKMLEYSLKSTNAELLVPSLNWKTADGVPVNKLILEVVNSQRFFFYMVERLSETLTDVVIIPHWETDDSSTILQVLYRSEWYISQLSSVSLFKWLQRTNIDVGKIVLPHWKTADGDTLLKLVCQSESCVSRISSTVSPSDGLLYLVFHSEYLISQITSQVILNWLNSTKFTFVRTILSSWKTKNGDSIFKLLCTSHICFSHISSSLMLQWLNGVDTPTFNILKSVHPDWTTSEGDAILHLLCKSSMKENKVVELLQYYLQQSILNPSLGDSDGNMAIHLACKADNLKCAIVSFFVSIDAMLDINDKNKEGLSPIEMTKDPEIMEKLIQHGAKVTSDVVFNIILSFKEHKACELLLLSITKQTILWKPTDVNGDGDTALHLACKVNKPDIVTFLLPNMEWNLNARNNSGLSPLEMTKNPEIILCICQYDDVEISSKAVKGWLNATFIDKEEIVKIFELLIHKHKLKTCDGSTLLHLCCDRVSFFRDTKTLVNYLLNQHHDPNYLDKNGLTPLQLTSDPQIMENLVQHGANVTSDVVFKIIRIFKEHKASEILLFSSTKKTMLLKPTDVNFLGCTALHLACKVDKLAVVKYILKHGNCNAAEKNSRNELPLELTTNIDTIILLIEHGATITPELVLKFAAIESIPNDRLAKLMWDPDIANSDGNTALHLACEADQQNTVNFLLSQAHSDPNIINNNEEVPLQMTTNSDIIKDLIRYGAQTSIMYEAHKSALGTNKPIKPPVKMFVVGNPSVGKSTLTEALKKTLNFVARLFTSGKVSGVEKKTVGIIPHEIESDIFGRVTVYDFAGHREFYSGHAALLKAAIQSTPPVFLLVVNLLDGEDEIIQNILYWISFLENQCTLVCCKPHLIIVGSHADTLKSKGVSPQEKVNTLVSLLRPNYFINLEFISFIPMDCQRHESTGMNDLRPLLVRSCSQLRIQEPITFNAHCFLVYLLETFKETPAVTISTIHEQIEKQLMSHREGVLDFLPKSTGALYKICVELNERGHILFLRDKINLENSYVVVEEKSLLSEVSGTVFASEDFKQYKRLASNTGVVSLSKLEKCFPGKDINIVIGFLTHLEFCHEISDQGLAQLISKKYSPNSHECYYLFPALILQKANFKESVWDSNCVSEYHFGWILQCAKYEQFFSSRFLQVLLLRLAFSFALESSTEDSDNLGIHRKCSLWKIGISWGTHFEMNVLVEINDNKFVIVMCRFNTSNLVKCLEHRSQVLHTVLECVEEFCPRISTVESFVDASSALEYPFELNSERTLCNVKDLSEALVSNCENPSVVLPESGKWVTAQSFISFEPYTEMEVSTLQELLDINNDNKVVSDVFVSRLVKKVSNNLPFLIKIFNEDAPFPCSKDNLYQEILNWRDISIAEPKTYSQLRKKLDQYSVFAGRNILVSIVQYGYFSARLLQ